MSKDIRLSIGFLDHPKTIKLQRVLGSDGVLALERLWMFAAQYRTDGNLSGMDIDDIEIACKWNGMQGALLTALLTHKWLDENTDEEGVKTYTLHGWSEHQGFIVHEKERSEQAKKAAVKRWGTKANAHSNADSIQSAMLNNANSNAPSPNPFPYPLPEDKKKNNKKEKVPLSIPPDINDVIAYCLERNNGVDPRQWYDSYQAKGWMIGKSKMIDWKAAVRTWEKNNGNGAIVQPSCPTENPIDRYKRVNGL